MKQRGIREIHTSGKVTFLYRIMNNRITSSALAQSIEVDVLIKHKKTPNVPYSCDYVGESPVGAPVRDSTILIRNYQFQ